MKSKAPIAFLACQLLLAGLPSSAQGLARDEVVSEVMRATGIASGCSSLPVYIAGLFEQQKAQFGNEKYSVLIGILSDSFSGTNMQRYIRDELAGKYDEALCKSILETYKNQLFIDITKRENDTLNIENEKMVAQFDYSAIDADRDKILDEFIDATKMIELEESMVIGALDVYMKTYNLFLPKGGKLDPDMSRQILDQTGKALRSDENRMNTKKRMAQTYESFTNEQLEEYFAFYRSEAGMWLFANYMKGFQKALEISMKDAAGRIISEFNLSEQNT